MGECCGGVMKCDGDGVGLRSLATRPCGGQDERMMIMGP